MLTEPIAMPIENITRNRLATSLLAISTFLASGGNWMNSTAPMVQKKLIARIAYQTWRSCMQPEIRRIELRQTLQSMASTSPMGGAGGICRLTR